MGCSNLHHPKAEGRKNKLGFWLQGTQKLIERKIYPLPSRSMWTCFASTHSYKYFHNNRYFHTILHFLIGGTVYKYLCILPSVCLANSSTIATRWASSILLTLHKRFWKCSWRHQRMGYLHWRCGHLRWFLGESFENSWTYIDPSPRENNFTINPLKCEWEVQETFVYRRSYLLPWYVSRKVTHHPSSTTNGADKTGQR